MVSKAVKMDSFEGRDESKYLSIESRGPRKSFGFYFQRIFMSCGELAPKR